MAFALSDIVCFASGEIVPTAPANTNSVLANAVLLLKIDRAGVFASIVMVILLRFD